MWDLLDIPEQKLNSMESECSLWKVDLEQTNGL